MAKLIFYIHPICIKFAGAVGNFFFGKKFADEILEKVGQDECFDIFLSSQSKFFLFYIRLSKWQFVMIAIFFWMNAHFCDHHDFKTMKAIVNTFSSNVIMNICLPSLVWRKWNGFCLSPSWVAGNGTEWVVKTIELSSPTSGGEQTEFLRSLIVMSP